MKSYKLITPYFKENRLLIIFGLSCLICVDVLQLLIPRVIKWAVDDLTEFKTDTEGLLVYASYIVFLAVFIAVFRYGWRRSLIGTSRLIEEKLRNRLFSHIQLLSASYFGKIKTGDLMAHATNDINHVRMATGMGMVALTDAVFLGTASIVFMAYINIKLTLLALIPMPMVAFSARFFSKKMHSRYQEVQGTFSDMTEVVRERFAGIRIIKMYNREEDEYNRLEDISKKYIKKNLKLIRVLGLFFPMMILFTNLSLAIVIFLGGRQTIDATITTGDFVAFINYLALLTWPMMAIGWVTNLIQRGAASLDRINNILKIKPEIDYVETERYSNPENKKKAIDIKGKIEFQNVSFSYEHDLQVLSDVSIIVEPSKMLGVVGSPGSGKTTLVSLLPRIFEIGSGSIMIDGLDIREMELIKLRNSISFVPQEPFLFAGTIRDNITFGSDDISEEELIRSVTEASIYDTIKSFTNGFDTIVGEKGVILSGGQKQRIALARAFLKTSPVLILDDPVSQVDTETGMNIINSLRSKAGVKTIIIVSHRLSALKFADQIIVMESGSITESGKHDELMLIDKYYARSYRMQEIQEELNAD
ncbi:MAG: ABC transporter ATP-binding protein [Desulfobacterales bacterium]|jgi:ATP-binding cassette, subfamily B, multidrug efflux pump|nr:ABC transporter ATP-binding protein [Desulfobacterales bacterium]MBT7697528.1 ABC transporter ATP-binding protein [Desulfobacterales bacterium]